MCTVKSIQDAIRECCQSQHDMEPIEIDQIVDNLPFFKEKSLFDTPPLPKPPYGRRKRPHSSFPPQFILDCGFFHALRTGRSETNGRISH